MPNILGIRHPLVARTRNLGFSCLASPRGCGNYTPIKYVGYTGQFALCTSASCTPDPSNNNILNCSCDVLNGPAVGLNDGKNFSNVPSGQVYSLYSGYNQSLLNKQTCSNGNWGDCLNKICTIDPTNPTKATCRCSTITDAPWITFQYKTNTSPCGCSNLSGALNTDYNQIEAFYNLYSFKY